MKIISRKSPFVMFILAAALLVLNVVHPMKTQSQDDEVIPLGIAPLSKRTPLLSFPLSVFPFVNASQGNFLPSNRFQELESLTIAIEDRTVERDTLSIDEDFLPLTASALSSGLALFKESGAQPGGFNFQIGDQNSDTPLDLFGAPTVEQDPANPRRFFVTFTPIRGSHKLSIFQDQFPDFYVVAQTSLNILHGDRFEVSIPANGITIRDISNPLPDNTLYDDRFPGEAFRSLNPDFAEPALFEGDLFELFSIVNENDNTTRVDASSEPKTIIGLESVGREDQGYFLKELRINFIGLNLGQIARLMANRSQAEYAGAQFAGLLAAAQSGQLSQLNLFPSFFYSPWFYNFPTNPETGELLTSTIETPDGPIEFPMTAPLDPSGFPLPAFLLGMDNLDAHVTGFTPFGPRLPNIGVDALTPRTIGPDILQTLSSNNAGGIFLYRELGGTPNQFDAGVDQILELDSNQFRVETFGINPDDVNTPGSPISRIVKRLIPGTLNEGANDTVSFLFQDTNLAADLLGVTALPDAVDGLRAPYGTLACYEDPDCFFFDLMINVLRPYLGLTEGQIRYLAEFTEENGITNMEELFGFPIVQGFTYILPIGQENALSDISIPASRTGDFAGPDIFVAIQTSDRLRALDSFVPFIDPRDIVVGTNVTEFTQGNVDGVTEFDSVSSLGVGRPNTDRTFAMIGRPNPRFQFEDLTQPGATPREANRNNILFDSSLSSPPKGVIGINAIDFGQNPNRVQNFEGISPDNFDVFFTESSVFREIQVEFLPTQSSPVFDPLIFNAIPVQLFVDLPFNRIITQHSVAIYQEDDTPPGNGIDDDGDGLTDEEDYNLVDDDGDGLIDEDLGDGTPAGDNSLFDVFDTFLPSSGDRFGSPAGFQASTYVWPPNDQDKYQEFIEAIEPDNQPFTLVDGGLLPLNLSEGSWFSELDLTALNFDQYQLSRFSIFPSEFSRIGITPAAAPEFDPPLLNQGTFTGLQPYNGLLDLFKALGLPDLIPDDLVVTHPATGEELFLLTLIQDDANQITRLEDPDGDERRTILLSLAAALRFPDPRTGFVRVGTTPLIVDVNGPNGQNPEGDNLDADDGVYQNGFFVEVADDEAIGNYLEQIADALADAIENAADLQADFEEQIADIEDDAASQDPPEEPDFADLELPEPVELSFDSPYEALGLNDFLEANNGLFDTNYQYQVQIPDENFGPLAGNDFYVVLRAGDAAQTGDAFRVRIRSGQRNRQLIVTDPTDNTQQIVDAPNGGIGYQSFIKTDFDVGSTAFPNVSKNQITTGPILVRSANVPPQISFLSPGAQQNVASEDFTFEVIFQANDPDNVATVRLFVDTDNQNFDGTFIPGAQLREGFENSFTVDMREDIPDFDPTQSFFIYAEINDGVNAPVFVYADGPIRALPSGGDGPGGGTGDDASNNGTTVVEGDLENVVDYVKLTDDGRIFTLGDGPGFNNVSVVTRSTDMEKTDNNSGAVILQDDGNILGSGDIASFQRRIQPNGEIAFNADEKAFLRNAVSGSELIESPTPGQISIEFARDVEVDFVNGAIYILDGDGDMLYLGNANTDLRPPAVDIDLYRDMELSPDGSTLYFLTGNGMFSTAGPNQVGEWNNLIAEDKYRDLELLVSGNSVSDIMIVDDDGRLASVAGSSRASAIADQAQSLTFPAGAVRQIKSFTNKPNSLLFLEGSGEVSIASDTDEPLPGDGFIFAENPGIDNDAVVDIETMNVNLQTVVEIVRDILKAIEDENVAGVMKYVAPDYKDDHGNTSAGLRRALTTFFDYYEMENYAVSSTVQNAFTISSIGDTVQANVVIDFSAFVPDIEFFSVDVEVGTQTPELFATFFANDFAFDQSIRLREVSDGRSWNVELWQITEFGRNIDELIDTDDLEFEDITFLTRQTGNRRLGFYQPRSRFIDEPKNFFINIDENNPLTSTGLMAIFREGALARDIAPPIMEFVNFFGNRTSANPLGNAQMEFTPNEDGTPQLNSMFLNLMIEENADIDLGLGDDADEPEPPISSLDGQTSSNPIGFSFKDRGPVLSLFPGEADVVLSNGELVATSPKGAVMMLPENTDIFAVNPQQLIAQFSRTTVRVNPFDPNAGQLNFPGFGATAEQGRSYLVINRDGETFGLLRLPEFTALDQGDADTIFFMDYRFEDSFVLPPNF